MLRKLIVLICLLSAQNTFAQSAKSPRATQKKIEYKDIGAPLPEFKMTVSDGKSITNADLKSESNLFMMIFNPLCGHCEDETDSLIKSMDLFKGSRLVMLVHPNNVGMMSGFIRGHHVDQYPKISVCIDSPLITDKLFLYQGLPQINIYDKRRKLIKTFSGDVSMDSLKQYIQ